ncbi:MAG: hypothetical protein Q9195_006623 [Heterodermia aff. obscurata]
MVLLLLRGVLICLHLAFTAVAAPNQRRAGDDSYGEVESSAGPIYYAQTTLPSSQPASPKATVPSTLQTLPNGSPLSSRVDIVQQSASAGSYVAYGLGSSGEGRYPSYNSTVPYASGIISTPQATSLPLQESQEAGQDQACSQGAGYAATTSTQTVTTVVTDTQTVTTVVTNTQTVTTVATSTSLITAYVTVTTTSTISQGTGSPLQGPGSGEVLSNANAVPYPTTAGTPNYAAQSMAEGPTAGAQYPSVGLPIQSTPALISNYTSPFAFGTAGSGQTQPELPSTQAFVPSQTGYGTAGQPVPSMSVPASQVYGDSSMPVIGGDQVPQISSQGYPSQGFLQSQQQPTKGYNAPLSTAPITNPAVVPNYPSQSQVTIPAMSTGANLYQSQNEGLGPQLPSTLPQYVNNTEGVTQIGASSIMPPYPTGASIPWSGSKSFPGATSTTSTCTTHPSSGTCLDCSTILLTSISHDLGSSFPTQSIPLAAVNTSDPIPPNTIIPPTNAAQIPATSAPSSLAPVQSICTPSITTHSAINFQQYPTNAPLPIPYLDLNYTTFTPTSEEPYSHILSTTTPHEITVPLTSPNTTFTLLSLLLSCAPQPSNITCTVNINGFGAPSHDPITGAARAGLASMSINVPPALSSFAGNGQEVAAEGGTQPATVTGVNGGSVPVFDAHGVGVPVAFTGSGWTGLQSVWFEAKLGGPWGTNGTGETGVGVDELVYEVVGGC